MLCTLFTSGPGIDAAGAARERPREAASSSATARDHTTHPIPHTLRNHPHKPNQNQNPKQDEDNLREALRYSAAMLGELRASYLSPVKYYELYMAAFDRLAALEGFFADERAKGRPYAELYELVQHAGNVLPRL